MKCDDCDGSEQCWNCIVNDALANGEALAQIIDVDELVNIEMTALDLQLSKLNHPSFQASAKRSGYGQAIELIYQLPFAPLF